MNIPTIHSGQETPPSPNTPKQFPKALRPLRLWRHRHTPRKGSDSFEAPDFGGLFFAPKRHTGFQYMENRW